MFCNQELVHIKKILTFLSAVLVSGGSASGDSYTPEKMVYVDKLSERAINTDYVNDTGHLLYLSVLSTNVANSKISIYVDNTLVVGNWMQSNTGAQLGATAIIPVGATYKVTPSSAGGVTVWQEAELPLAVATGDSIVTQEGTEVTVGDDEVTKTMLKGDVQLEEREFLSNLYDKAVEGLGNAPSDDSTARTYTIQLPKLYGTWEVSINGSMHKQTGGAYGTRNIVLHCGGLSGYPYTGWAMAHNEVTNMARTQTGPAPTITLVMEKENKIKVTLSGTGGKKSSWSARLMSTQPSY